MAMTLESWTNHHGIQSMGFFHSALFRKFLIPCLLLFFTWYGSHIIDSPACFALSPNTEDTQLAWQAVLDYLAWEKYWQGTFFGESCYQHFQGQSVPVHFSYVGSCSAFAQSSPQSPCDGSERESVPIESFTVQIADSVLLYSVEGDRPALSPSDLKYRAGIIPFAADPDDPCLIFPDTYSLFQAKYRRDPCAIEWTQHMMIPPISQQKPPRTCDPQHEAIVFQAVQRTMSHYLRAKYVDPSIPQESHVSTLRDQVKAHTHILLGRFTLRDPYLLVYYPGDETLYQLEFPSVDLLADQQICLKVYHAGMYMGPDYVDEHTVKMLDQHLIQNVQEHSFQLELREWDW
jgi:hypothetical protein